MKLSSILAAALLNMACASPVQKEKRSTITDVILETATITVTASHSHWSHRTRTTKSSSSKATTITKTITKSVSQTQAATPPTSTSTSSTPSTQQNPTSTLSSYAAPILEQHNLHRTNHSSPPLTWSSTLATIAAEIASSCYYAHNMTAGSGISYGQNIGAGAIGTDVPKMITNQMYNDEIMFYPGPYGGTKDPDMTNFERWGHFSQIVWKGTSEVGCFTQFCGEGGLGNVGGDVAPYFTVCNYGPAGNFAGEYAANVLAPLGQAPIFL